MANNEDATSPRKPAAVRIKAPGNGQRRPVSESLAPAPSVTFDLRHEEATFRIADSPSSRAAEVSIPSHRLIFLSYYVRARQAFSSDAQMAEMLGLDRTRLIAWKKGTSAPRHEHVRYLADVATTVDALLRFLHPSVVAGWLVSPQFDLRDRTPVEMLRDGRLPDVLLSVNAMEHGAYI